MLTSFPILKICLLIVTIMVAIAIICDIFIKDSNVQKFIAFGTIATAMGAITALIFLMKEANQLKQRLKLQYKSFSLGITQK